MAAAGGGAATNAGIDFQQRFGALIMVMMLTNLPDLGVLGLGWDDYTVQSLHFETDDAIDDLVLITDGPSIFIQAKRSLHLSSEPTSEFSSTLRQFVGQFLRDPSADQRYLIATSNDASRRIRLGLRKLTEAARLNANKLKADPLTKAEVIIQQATASLLDHHFSELSGRPISDIERDRLWRRIHVAGLDVVPGGGLEKIALTALAGCNVRNPQLIWGSLVALGLELATARLSIGRAELERRMARYGLVRQDNPKAAVRNEMRDGRPGIVPLPWDALHPNTAVARPQLMGKLIVALKSNADDGVTVVSGVYGAGGFGKTTLVKQLCALPEIRSLYNALLWITLGEDVQRGRASRPDQRPHRAAHRQPARASRSSASGFPAQPCYW